MWPRGEPLPALLLTAAFGWVWGSFLNQLADRSPYRGAPPAGAPAPPPPGVTWRQPARSVCFACGAPIPWFDNVPVLAWLWLRGCCRRCGAPIGRRTLAVELATPLLLVGWHAAWRAADGSIGTLLPGAGLAGWLLLLVVLWAEGRRVHPGLLLAGAALLLGFAAGVLLPGG